MNPVRAGLAARAADWPWSSARAHLAARDEGVVSVAPLLARIGDFASLLEGAEDEAAVLAIRRSRTTGRPVGAAAWIAELEAATARRLAPGRRGRKPRAAAEDQGDLFGVTAIHTVSP